MKKPLVVILFCLAFFQQLSAQNPAPARFNKAVFVEAFGMGMQASLNYDMRIKKGVQDGLGFRVGIGGIFTGTADADAGPEPQGVLAFPVGINYLIGENRNAFEIGLGLMPHRAATPLHSPTKPKIIEKNGWGTNGFLNLGYRFQPINNGFTFRFDWTPVFGGVGFISRFGISAGYGFK